MAITWHDKSPVTLLTSVHESGDVSEESVSDKKLGKVNIKRPNCFTDYNLYMNGCWRNRSDKELL